MMASGFHLDWGKTLFPFPRVELRLILKLVLMFNNAVLLHVKSKPTFLLPNNYVYDIVHLQYYARRSLEMSI